MASRERDREREREREREINVKGQKLGTVTNSSTLEQLFRMKAQNQRFSQGLHKPLQL